MIKKLLKTPTLGEIITNMKDVNSLSKKDGEKAQKKIIKNLRTYIRNNNPAPIERFFLFNVATNLNLVRIANELWDQTTMGRVLCKKSTFLLILQNYVDSSKEEVVKTFQRKVPGDEFFVDLTPDDENHSLTKEYAFKINLGREFFIAKEVSLNELDFSKKLAIYFAAVKTADAHLLSKIMDEITYEELSLCRASLTSKATVAFVEEETGKFSLHEYI